MTTTVKIHVGGQYQATVTRIVQGAASPDPVVVIGPEQERSFPAHGDRMITFLVQEEPYVKPQPEPQPEEVV